MNRGKSTRFPFSVIGFEYPSGCHSLWISEAAGRFGIHNVRDSVGLFGMRGNLFTSIVVAAIS